MRPLRMHGQNLRSIDEKLVFLSLVVASLTFLPQLLGLVTPGWYYGEYTIKGQDKRLLRGLWYTVECTEGTCETYANTENETIAEAYLKYQIMTAVATAFSLIAMAAAISHKRSIRPDGTKHWLRVITFLGSFLSGTIALIAAGINSNHIIRGQGDVLRSDNIREALFPFSCFFFAIGGLAAFVCAISIFIVIVRHPLNLIPLDIKHEGDSDTNEIYIFGEGANITSGANQQPVSVFPDNGHVSQGKEVQEIVLHPEMEVMSQPNNYNAVTVTPQRIVYAPSHEIRPSSLHSKPYYTTELYHYPYVPAIIHAPSRYHSNRHSAKQLQVLGAL